MSEKVHRGEGAIPSDRGGRRLTVLPGSKGVRMQHYVMRVGVCIHVLVNKRLKKHYKPCTDYTHPPNYTVYTV